MQIDWYDWSDGLAISKDVRTTWVEQAIAWLLDNPTKDHCSLRCGTGCVVVWRDTGYFEVWDMTMNRTAYILEDQLDAASVSKARAAWQAAVDAAWRWMCGK